MKWILVVLALTLPVQAADTNEHVVILFDTSGSMEETMGSTNLTKMVVAKSALIGVLQEIPQTTRVGLLIFEGWAYDLQGLDRDKLTQTIQKIEVGDKGTPLGTFMKVGVDRLLQEREQNQGYGTYKLLIVTDGESTNEDPGLIDQYLPEIVSRGITVQCIGVDMASKHTLSTKVHSYMNGNDPNSLKQSLTKVLGEVSSSKDDLSQFEEIGDLPTPVAQSIIDGLSTTGNHPIGEQPTVADNNNQETATVDNQGTTISIGMSIISFVLFAIFIAVIVAGFATMVSK